METKTKILKISEDSLPLILENGDHLNELYIAYETYGKLNSDCSNTILVCHALTGDAHAAGISINTDDIFSSAPLLKVMKQPNFGWWDGVIGPDKTFDTNRYHIICSNILGSCYGTTGPMSTDCKTGKIYGSDFPLITVRDMVRVQKLFLQQIGIEKLAIVTGGSLGGMQTLEWAIMYPEMINTIIPMGTAARHSDWCVGINHLARQAIVNDPAWNDGDYTRQPADGLSLARKIAMISYRADLIFNQRFNRSRIDGANNFYDQNNIFQVESYLNHQGNKLVDRFDANSYMRLSNAMDLHDVGLGRGGYKSALGSIKANTLCIGINTDILYPAHEQIDISNCIPNAQYAEIESKFGHDAFLVEFDQMKNIIESYLSNIDTLNPDI